MLSCNCIEFEIEQVCILKGNFLLLMLELGLHMRSLNANNDSVLTYYLCVFFIHLLLQWKKNI